MPILIESYPYLDVTTPALARLLLDNAIVLRQNSELEGRMGLHAAAAGGDVLTDVYRHCGLLRLSKSANLPALVRRSSDGRFFYADNEVAEALAAALDASR